mgnify:CR=1 FL=1
MVFIHPLILKNDQQVRQVSQRRYNFMKTLQRQASENQGEFDQDNSLLENFDTFTPVNNGQK